MLHLCLRRCDVPFVEEPVRRTLHLWQVASTSSPSNILVKCFQTSEVVYERETSEVGLACCFFLGRSLSLAVGTVEGPSPCGSKVLAATRISRYIYHTMGKQTKKERKKERKKGVEGNGEEIKAKLSWRRR